MKQALKFVLLTLLLSAGYVSVEAQTAAEQRGLDAITIQTLKAQEEFLASPLLEGRYCIDRGAFVASDYIASMLGVLGLQPAGDKQTYFQSFNIFRYFRPSNELMEISSGGKTVMPLANADYYTQTRRVQNSFRIDADAVFAGYGLFLPAYGVDSYGKLDVKGKVVVLYPTTESMLKGAPWDSKNLTPTDKQAILSNALSEAKRRGAAAIVYIKTESEVANNIPKSGKPAGPVEDIIALPHDSTTVAPLEFAVSRAFLREPMAAAGISVDAAPSITAKPSITKVHFKISGDATCETYKVRNVIGVVKGEDTTRCVVVGAHYDHLGLWGSTLYPGADDNASGTVGVLTMAKALKESGIKPKVNVVFGFWTAEEKGLWGSTYYTRNPYIPMASTSMYINYDMIGRSMPKDTLSLEASFFYYQNDTTIKTKALSVNQKLGNPLSLKARPTLGGPGSRSDHGPFSMYKVPFMGWMTAFHTDYHQPTDTPVKIDYVKMQKVVKVGFLNLLSYIY